jgi:hypothetical protein
LDVGVKLVYIGSAYTPFFSIYNAVAKCVEVAIS